MWFLMLCVILGFIDVLVLSVIAVALTFKISFKLFVKFRNRLVNWLND